MSGGGSNHHESMKAAPGRLHGPTSTHHTRAQQRPGLFFFTGIYALPTRKAGGIGRCLGRPDRMLFFFETKICKNLWFKVGTVLTLHRFYPEDIDGLGQIWIPIWDPLTVPSNEEFPPTTAGTGLEYRHGCFPSIIIHQACPMLRSPSKLESELFCPAHYNWEQKHAQCRGQPLLRRPCYLTKRYTYVNEREQKSGMEV